MRNIKAILAYDGSNYHGFQYQKDQDVPTIQEELEKALSASFYEKIKIEASGRTDAGVHARGQVFNFYLANEVPVEKMPIILNRRLPKDIVVKETEEVHMNFHSRYLCTGKHYSYSIYNNSISSPFLRNYFYQIPYKIDWDKVREACPLFLGKHNFKSFVSKKNNKYNFIRTIYEFDLTNDGDKYIFNIKGDGFLYNMVRIMIGTLLDIGRGQMPKEAILEAFEGQKRIYAGRTAPANGLCLEEVYYSSIDTTGSVY